MKFLVVIAFLMLAVYSIRADLTKEELISITAACKEEAGASDADLQAMIKHEAALTTEGKCMHACTLKKLGVMNDEGKLVKETSIELSKQVIKDEAKKELAEEIIESCEGLEVSDDHCEASEQYRDCVIAKFESKGIDSAEDLI